MDIINLMKRIFIYILPLYLLALKPAYATDKTYCLTSEIQQAVRFEAKAPAWYSFGQPVNVYNSGYINRGQRKCYRTDKDISSLNVFYRSQAGEKPLCTIRQLLNNLQIRVQSGTNNIPRCRY